MEVEERGRTTVQNEREQFTKMEALTQDFLLPDGTSLTFTQLERVEKNPPTQKRILRAFVKKQRHRKVSYFFFPLDSKERQSPVQMEQENPRWGPGQGQFSEACFLLAGFGAEDGAGN